MGGALQATLRLLESLLLGVGQLHRLEGGETLLHGEAAVSGALRGHIGILNRLKNRIIG
jgi:hypothetical protein